MYQLMKNSVTEHQLSYSHLDKVINILGSSLDMAIYLARKSTGSNIGDYVRVMPVTVSNLDYQHQFRDLNEILRNNE